MPSTDLLIAFLAATLVFAYMPGPAMLYAAAQTVAKGRRGGWLAALGLHIGGYAHIIAASLGLAVLFQIVPVLYMAFKFAGAAYLIWLGVKLFMARQAPVTTSPQMGASAPRKAFWESITVELLNPKAALFYVAFLPQFTDPAAAFPVWLQLFILGTMVNFLFTSADIFCILLADRVTAFLRGSRSAGRLAQRIGGGVMIGLGLNVALNRQ